ncbi:hypothetical protein PMI21_00068 [Pseudomonas sp. GM18]|uniref:hypothetical protein n=1 Tax=Pseudomonas sp. GM18 TaxID=1144324 RepID=UPI0002727B2D|nr:hypothetical protein [Pseudomonas sp. GM18]EJM22257.1 hypothetical protein PMI21_00068 [Pseudomonas sp. GM18]
MSDIPAQELSDFTKMEREDLLHESSRPGVICPASAHLNYPTQSTNVQGDSIHPIASTEFTHSPSEIRHSTFANP